MSKKLKPLALAAVILVLAGCSTPTSAPTTKGALDAFKTLSMSKKDTCQTQREIADHNSRYDTLKTGKDVTYKPPCDVEKKVAAKPPMSLGSPDIVTADADLETPNLSP
jgi:hypothetical protein